MPFYDLHNFACLQIPDEDFSVLTSADNIKSMRRHKFGGYTIRSVRMAGIGL